MNKEEEVVIKVNSVYKDFLLLHQRAGSVKGVFTSMFSKATTKKETQHALKNISFEIKKGEFFGIVGRNGSGKSTLLKILAGIYQPTKGSVEIKGKLVPFIELGVGFNPELSGRDNVYLNGSMLGFSSKEIDKMYDDIVGFAELERFMDQKLKNYSSGMQVRLAFSMATHAEADVLLIDEVLAVGDADFQRKCFDYFRQLKRNQKTVVFVSHDMNSVREYCDRAILIDKNKIISRGSAYEVAKQYSKMFLEEAPSDVTENDISTENPKRWGIGKVKFTSVKTDNIRYSTQKYIEIECTASANVKVENVIFGFLIKNATGQMILGTNTQLKKHKIPLLNKGDKIRVVWRVPNIFSDGTYTVDPAIALTDGQTCDWWEDCTSFNVIKEDHAAYLIAPDIELEITK